IAAKWKRKVRKVAIFRPSRGGTGRAESGSIPPPYSSPPTVNVALRRDDGGRAACERGRRPVRQTPRCARGFASPFLDQLFNGIEAAMTQYDIDPLELAALVASRVCHDIISPVGAIVNGLEVLEEEKDESMREFAQDLVQKSARQASAKLQFSRLAFGASGGAGAELDMADAGRVSAAFMEREKPQLDWQVK